LSSETEVRFYPQFKVRDSKVAYIYDHDDRTSALEAPGCGNNGQHERPMKWAKISSCTVVKGPEPTCPNSRPMILLELLGALFLVSVPIAAVEGCHRRLDAPGDHPRRDCGRRGARKARLKRQP
jgi:hypothetical protein